MNKLVLVLALLLAIVFPWLVPNPAVTSVAIFTLLYAASATGWNIFSGSTGSISLGHATFFGVGAYTLALLCQHWNISSDIVPLLLVPLSGMATCLIALPAGWVALRVRGNTFVIITIALFFSFQLLAYNLSGITNGSIGMNLPTPSWSGDVYNTPFYDVTLSLVILAMSVAWGGSTLQIWAAIVGDPRRRGSCQESGGENRNGSIDCLYPLGLVRGGRRGDLRLFYWVDRSSLRL